MHFHVHLKPPHSVVSDKRVSVERTNMATWQYHEMKLLLQLWADRNVQEQPSSLGRNIPLGDNLPKNIRKNAGHDRTGTQCKTRIYNLAQRYKKEKRL